MSNFLIYTAKQFTIVLLDMVVKVQLTLSEDFTSLSIDSDV